MAEAEDQNSGLTDRDEEVLKIACDLKTAYDTLGIQIKPTALSLVMLLTAADRLCKSHNNKTKDNMKSSSPNGTGQTSVTSELSKARQLPLNYRAGCTGNSLQEAAEQTTPTKKAVTKFVQLVADQGIGEGQEETISQQAISSSTRSETPLCDREIRDITNQSETGYSWDDVESLAAEGSMDYQHGRMKPVQKKNHVKFTSSVRRKTVHIMQDMSNLANRHLRSMSDGGHSATTDYRDINWSQEYQCSSSGRKVAPQQRMKDHSDRIYDDPYFEFKAAMMNKDSNNTSKCRRMDLIGSSATYIDPVEESDVFDIDSPGYQEGINYQGNLRDHTATHKHRTTNSNQLLAKNTTGYRGYDESKLPRSTNNPQAVTHKANPVKRTASMPVHRFQPPTDKIYGTGGDNTHYGFVRTERNKLSHEQYKVNPSSERPGRGVFSESGHKIHQGQSRSASPSKPPRLPVRNLGNSSESHPNMPLMRQSMPQSGSNSIAQSYRLNNSTLGKPYRDSAHDSSRSTRQQDAVDHPRYDTLSRARSTEQETYSPVSQQQGSSYNIQERRRPDQSPHLNQYGFTQQAYPSRASNSNSSNPVPVPSRAQTSQSQEPIAHHSQISSRVPLPYEQGPAHQTSKLFPQSSMQQASLASDTQRFNSCSLNMKQQTPPVPQPRRTAVVPQRSHKYQMMVCPDFFPIAKLNGTQNPRRKSRIDEFDIQNAYYELESPAEDSDVGFYGNYSVHNSIPKELLTKLDDSFAEDSKEQYLYSTRKPTTNTSNTTLSPVAASRNTTTDFYFEVNIPPHTNALQQMDQSHSSGRDAGYNSMDSPQISHSSEQADSLQSSQVSSSIQDSEQPIAPPRRFTNENSIPQPDHSTNLPQHMTEHQTTSSSLVQSHDPSRRQPTNQRQRSPVYHERFSKIDIPPYQDDEYLQYESSEEEGQRGETARVLAHIEPAVSNAGAHSTVHVYKAESAPITSHYHTETGRNSSSPARPPWEARQSRVPTMLPTHQRSAAAERVPFRSRSSERYIDPSTEQPSHNYQSKTLQRDTKFRQKSARDIEPHRQEAYQPNEHSRQSVKPQKGHDHTIIHKPVASRPTTTKLPASNTYENLSHIQYWNDSKVSSVSNPDYMKPSCISKTTELVSKTGLEVSSSQSEQDSALAHSSPKQENDSMASQRKDIHRAKIVNFVEPPDVRTRDDAEESDDSDESPNRAMMEDEISKLMDNLAVGNQEHEGLGDDILSITRMWRSLSSSGDSLEEKRKALMNDQIMSAITHKMQAILKDNKSPRKNPAKNPFTVSNIPFDPNSSELYSQKDMKQQLQSPQSPSEVGLVTREPGEGSSDDLDDSADHHLHKRLSPHRAKQRIPSINQEQYRQLRVSRVDIAPTKPTTSQLPVRNDVSKSDIDNRSSSGTFRSKIPSQSGLVGKQVQRFDGQRTAGDLEVPKLNLSKLNTHSNDRQPEDTSQILPTKQAIDPAKENLFVKRSSKVEDSRQKKQESADVANRPDLSDSEESDAEDTSFQQTTKQVEESDSDESEEAAGDAEAADVQYLSEFHRNKTRGKARNPSKKKISFSTDANRSRPGDLIKPKQAGALLSVDPFMNSDGSKPEGKAKNSKLLLSVNPFMADEDDTYQSPPSVIVSPGSSGSDVEVNGDKQKPKQGILKRSDESGGSQLSLGTCSNFGSHISLDSAGSGVSRAGSFPLLTMSDGSKKNFQIAFNDVDVNSMGNLFKVNRKARSEGAASEPESTDSDSDDDAMPILCKYCQAKQPLFKARLIYKMCHGCYTYYCSSECRRSDWTAHKPLCIVSRLSSLARKIFKCVTTDQELLHHCSRFARTGYLCQGRGAVVLSFASPRKAQLFLSNAKQAKESALYLSIRELQKFTFDDKRDRDQLLANCRHYNPDEKFVLHLAIKMNKSSFNQAIEPRIRGREFHKWARIRLIERSNARKREAIDEEDTLILTAMSGSDQQSADVPERKIREVFFANVQTKLRKRGISLRHQYPDVYNALCHYTESGKMFSPISLFAFNLNTQKRFMCCIMPYSDPEVNWGTNPHLLEDLDLAVTL